MSDRPVQTSLIEGMERPVGRLVGSVVAGSNADLMAAVAPFYLTGSVLDVTFGLGSWWKRFQPDPFVGLGPEVDFRRLPYSARSFSTVCFDPPYIPAGGAVTSTEPDFRARYGLVPMNQATLDALVQDGLREVARVADRWVLVKCCDYVNSGVFVMGHLKVIDAAREIGLGMPWDLIVHHTGSGPGGHNIYTPIRARRHHSYLLVWNVA